MSDAQCQYYILYPELECVLRLLVYIRVIFHESLYSTNIVRIGRIVKGGYIALFPFKRRQCAQ
jgi:hypothetical protein